VLTNARPSFLLVANVVHRRASLRVSLSEKQDLRLRIHGSISDRVSECGGDHTTLFRCAEFAPPCFCFGGS
jgi:hypothetical protein